MKSRYIQQKNSKLILKKIMDVQFRFFFKKFGFLNLKEIFSTNLKVK